MVERAKLSRRGFLGAGLLAALAETLPSDRVAQARPGSAPAAKTRSRARATAPGAPYVAPFTITAQSQLSQDYFRTDLIVPGPDAKVCPYYRSDGTPAALVLDGGVVSIVAADPSTPSGYSFQTVENLPTPDFRAENEYVSGGPTDLVVASGKDGKPHALLAYPVQTFGKSDINGLLPTAYVWGEVSGATIGRTGSFTRDVDLGPYVTPIDSPARVTLDGSGVVTFYVFPASDTCAQMSAGSQDADVRTIADSARPAGLMRDARLLLDYQGVDYVVIVTADGFLEYTEIGPLGNAYIGLDGGFGAGGKLLRFDLISTASGDVPSVLYWKNDAQGTGIFFKNIPDDLYDSDAVVRYRAFSDAAVLTSNARWSFLAAAEDSGDYTLSVINQFASLPDGQSDWTASFTDPIPFARDITRVWAPLSGPVDATTFFVLGVDGALRVLRRPTASGPWQLVPIRRPSASTTDITMWRTLVVVRDSHGIAVPDYVVDVSADVEVALWQDGGSTTIATGQQATFTTNILGQVTLATPATSLHTAVLQIGGEGAKTITVAPHSDVHQFLAGKMSLDAARGSSATGMFTADTLANAMVGSAPLSPLLARLDGASRTTAATAFAKAITKTMQIGLNPKPAAGDPTSFSFSTSSGTPVYTSSSFSGDRFATRQALTSFAPWDWAKDVAQDIGQALESVSSSVTSATYKYTEDAGQWVGTLSVEFGNGVTSTFEYVVKDARTAVAAVTGLLATLGADLEKTIAWLRALLDGLIKQAIETASTLSGYLGELPARVTKYATPLKGDIDTAFTDLGTLIDPYFDAAVQRLGGGNNSKLTDYKTMTVTNPDSGDSFQPTDLIDLIVNDVQGNWVLNKVLSLAAGLPSIGAAAATTTALEQLAAKLTKEAIADVSAATQTVVDDITKFAGNSPEKVAEYAVADLLGFTKLIFDSGLGFLDTIGDELIDLAVALVADFDTLLRQGLDQGVLGIIEDVLDVLDISFEPTLRNVLSLVLAFPATLLERVLGGGSSSFVQPADFRASTHGPRQHVGLDAVTKGGLTLNAIYAVAVALQNDFTNFLDFNTALGRDDTKFSVFSEIISVFCTATQTLLDYPGTGEWQVNGEPTIYQRGLTHAPLPDNTLLYSWLFEFAPFVVEIAVTCIDGAFLKFGADGSTEEVIAGTAAVLYAIMGSVLAVGQTFVAIDEIPVTGNNNTDRTPGVFNTVLCAIGWLPTVMEILTLKDVNADAYYIPLGCKLVLNDAVNIGDVTLLITGIFTD